jgi:hypothetical protein
MRSGSGKLMGLLLAATVLLAAAPTPVPPPPPAPGDPGFAAFVAERAGAYLRARQEEFAKRREQYALAQLQAHYDVIRAAVSEHLSSGADQSPDPTLTPELLRRHRVETVTGLLLNSGYRSEQFAHRAGARTLVRAMDNIFGGDADALVLAAPTVFVAEQSGTNPTTLHAVRAAARAHLCSPGYVPVGAGVDLPHRC